MTRRDGMVGEVRIACAVQHPMSMDAESLRCPSRERNGKHGPLRQWPIISCIMQALLRNLHFGVRMFGKNPGFTVAAVVTLALGIGANTALFTVTSALLLR